MSQDEKTRYKISPLVCKPFTLRNHPFIFQGGSTGSKICHLKWMVPNTIKSSYNVEFLRQAKNCPQGNEEYSWLYNDCSCIPTKSFNFPPFLRHHITAQTAKVTIAIPSTHLHGLRQYILLLVHIVKIQFDQEI